MSLFLDLGVGSSFFFLFVEAILQQLSELEIAGEVLAHAFGGVVDMFPRLGPFVVELEANRDFFYSSEVVLGHLG